MRVRRNQSVQELLKRRFGRMLPILLGETDVTLNGAVTIGDQLKTGFNLRGPSICMTLERVSSVIKTERLYIGTNTLQNHLKLEIAKPTRRKQISNG